MIGLSMQALRPVQRVLAAVCAAACVAIAQPSPGARIDAVEAKALLESSRLADRAWGAYMAAQLRDRTLQQSLLEQLHWAESMRWSLADGDGYAYIQSLLDALIQLGAPVPVQAILPYTTRWRAETLTLFALGTIDPGETALLEIRGENLNDAEWLAVNNLLLRLRSKALIGRTLREIYVWHDFFVSDTDETLGSFGGESSGLKPASVEFPKAFPPIGIYQLEIDLLGAPPEDALVIRGPMHQDDVLCRRVIVSPGARVPRPRANLLRTDRQKYRRAYIAELSGLSMADADALFCPRTNLRWQSAEDFTRKAKAAMASQAKGISDFLKKARRNGLIDAGGMRFTIDPVIHDMRDLPGGRDPIPPVDPREIQLD